MKLFGKLIFSMGVLMLALGFAFCDEAHVYGDDPGIPQCIGHQGCNVDCVVAAGGGCAGGCVQNNNLCSTCECKRNGAVCECQP